MSQEPPTSALPPPELSRNSISVCIAFTAAALWGLIIWCNAMGFSDGADFVSFYTAGRIVGDGAAAKLYDTEVQLAYQHQIFSRANLLPYYHPAYETLLFVPLALLSYSGAYVVWAGVNVAMMMALPFLLRPFVRTPRNLLGVALLCFLFLPLWIALLQGQDSILLLLLLTLSFRSLSRGGDFVAGLFIGLSMFKFQFALPLLVVLLGYRSLRLVGGAVAGGLSSVLASFAVTGVPGQLSFVRLLLSTNNNLAFATIDPEIMPNVRGFLSTLLGDSMSQGSLRTLITLASLAIVVSAMGIVLRSERPRELVAPIFSLAMLAMVLVSYHLNPHDLSLLLLPLLLVGELVARNRSAVSNRLAIGANTLIIYSPVTLLVLMQHSSLNFEFVPILVLFVLVGVTIVGTKTDEEKRLAAGTMSAARSGDAD